MEKLTHELPGSNIVMSEAFVRGLSSVSPNTVELGHVLFKGQENPVRLHLVPSDALTPEKLQSFLARNILMSGAEDSARAA
jgi:hypothetical protein